MVSTPNWAEVLEAVGTLMVAILAIWGDELRTWLLGPRLDISVAHAVPTVTQWTQTKKMVYYHHLRITNKRRGLAESVRVVCTEIWKKASDGRFHSENLSYPVQFPWTPQQLGQFAVNIRTYAVCDLGFLTDGDDKFQLATFAGRPNNFKGFVGKGETIMVGVEVVGKNVASKKPYLVEISWDGEWIADRDEMAKKHLIVGPGDPKDVEWERKPIEKVF